MKNKLNTKLKISTVHVTITYGKSIKLAKTVNTRIISGMLLCCEEKANQMQDEKPASCNDN